MCTQSIILFQEMFYILLYNNNNFVDPDTIIISPSL